MDAIIQQNLIIGITGNTENIGNNIMVDLDDMYVINNTKKETDLCTMSWSELVDSECGHNLENKLMQSSLNEEDMPKLSKFACTIEIVRDKFANYQYSISDIITKNLSTLDDVTILEYQTYVASNLNKYIRQYNENPENLNMDDLKMHLPKFEWLAAASKFLCTKLDLPIQLHKNYIDKTGLIARSSYKFCEFNYECEFNYKDKSHRGCYAQHYVHNIVYADMVAIICYIKDIIDNKNKLNIIELSKCIKTVSFVIKHMMEELVNVKYRYCTNNNVSINQFHIEKSKNKKNINNNNIMNNTNNIISYVNKKKTIKNK